VNQRKKERYGKKSFGIVFEKVVPVFHNTRGLWMVEMAKNLSNTLTTIPLLNGFCNKGHIF
jgi:hypothetical protein